jgi:Flp pilus assembly protein TadG
MTVKFMKRTSNKTTCNRRTHRRLGAILSMELVVVLPIVIAVCVGMVELSMLWSASHRAQSAAAAGCRVATYPGATMHAVRQAIETNLSKANLIRSYQVEVVGGLRTGDEIAVTVNVPQSACAPDMLRPFGFSLQGKFVTARSVMRRE